MSAPLPCQRRLPNNPSLYQSRGGSEEYLTVILPLQCHFPWFPVSVVAQRGEEAGP